MVITTGAFLAVLTILIILIILRRRIRKHGDALSTVRRRWAERGLTFASGATAIALAICAVNVAILVTDRPSDGSSSQRDDASESTTRASPDRTDELNAIFAAAGDGEMVVLPPGTYHVRGHVLLPRSKNVSVDASGATFHGHAVFVAVTATGLQWTGGRFSGNGTAETRLIFNLFKSRDMTFTEMTFDRALGFGNHAFDLLGSRQVTFDGLTIAGYGDRVDTTDVPQHAIYAEAIQLDRASEIGVGNTTTVDLIQENGGRFDGSVTREVTVKNSFFTPSYDTRGEMTAWAPAPFGSHLAPPAGEEFRNIRFVHNSVVDPIPTTHLLGGEWSGALHFAETRDLKISSNYFEFSGSEVRDAWIEIAPQPHRERAGQDLDVVITDNTFAGTPPGHGQVMPSGGGTRTLPDDLEYLASGNRLLAVGVGATVPLIRSWPRL